MPHKFQVLIKTHHDFIQILNFFPGGTEDIDNAKAVLKFLLQWFDGLASDHDTLLIDQMGCIGESISYFNALIKHCIPEILQICPMTATQYQNF